jgi:DNA-binding MarR family transcriptional regulator
MASADNTRSPEDRVDTRAPALPATLAASTGFLLSKAAQRALGEVEAALQPLGIRTRHYGALAALAEAGPLSQQRLGEWLRVDRTTMVALVDDLERLGLATRQRLPNDRRAYALELSSAGKRTLSRARRAIASAEDATLAILEPAERKQLHNLLQRLL